MAPKQKCWNLKMAAGVQHGRAGYSGKTSRGTGKTRPSGAGYLLPGASGVRCDVWNHTLRVRGWSYRPLVISCHVAVLSTCAPTVPPLGKKPPLCTRAVSLSSYLPQPPLLTRSFHPLVPALVLNIIVKREIPSGWWHWVSHCGG